MTSYLPTTPEKDLHDWDNAPLSGTNSFEMIGEGSEAEFTNIPLRRIALIRERTPWQTPDGTWARAYGFADGDVEIDASDDNFQSFEAQYILPPQAKGP